MTTPALTLADDGYVVLRGMIDRTLAETLRAKTETAIEQHWRETLPPQYETDCDRVAAMRALRRANPAYWTLPVAWRDTLSGQAPWSVRMDALIPTLLQPLVPTLREALDSDALWLHQAPVLRCILQEQTWAAVPTHQDGSYNPQFEGDGSSWPAFVTVWVPLVEMDGLGGLGVYPGTQTRPVTETTVDGMWRTPLDTTGLTQVLVEATLGDAVVFVPTLWHVSVPATDTRRRFSLDARVFGRHTHSTRPATRLEVA